MLHTPNTIYLSVYRKDELTACVGSLRTLDGSIEPGVIETTGASPWQAVALALEEAEIIRAQNLVIFTNDAAWAEALRTGQPPEPDKTEKRWMQKGKGRGNGEYLHIPYGGDPNQWTCLRLFHLAYWARGGRSFIIVVDEDKLKKARELWEEQRKSQ